jgi:hypothetical protein
MSQFFIIAQTGPVSSTVVGHVKTCSIVALGWMTSGRAVGDKSVFGVLIAVGGIIAYVSDTSSQYFSLTSVQLLGSNAQAQSTTSCTTSSKVMTPISS